MSSGSSADGGGSTTGADLVVSALESAGVEVVFGLPGVHNLALWKSLHRSGIRLVTVRHEQAAAYAADGYARTTGRVGIALTTTGPGAANTLGAVGEAWAGRSSVVVIATDIPSALRRPGVYRGALHETTDQGAMFAPVVKSAFKVPAPEQAGAIVAAGIASAVEPPARPVYVEIPTDFLAESCTPFEGATEHTGRSRVPADQDSLDRALEAAVEAIDGAKRPLVWAGGGAVASGLASADAIGRLAERLAAPLVTTYQGRGLVGAHHPCAVGLPPHIPEVGQLWDEADVVIAVGTDFDGMMTQNWRMPAPSRLVAINVDPVDASKNYEPDILIEADAAGGVTRLLTAVTGRSNMAKLEKRLEGIRRSVRDRLRDEEPDAATFLESFEESVPEECVVVADMCIPGYWLAAFHPVSGPRRLAYPVGWGTLGFAFPAGIGAALGAVGPVVSVSGDGGFLFACGELATVAQEKIPLTAVVVDDGGYGMLRFDQRNAGDELFGVDLDPPDFVELAHSFGVRAQEVEGLGKDFAVALAEHVARPGPSMLVAKAALDPPPTTSPRWYRNVAR